MARSTRSMRIVFGRNSGKRIEVMNKMVTNGTPRTASMNTIHRPLTTGRELCLPSASSTPIGKEATMPTSANRKVSSKPPHWPVSTKGR